MTKVLVITGLGLVVFITLLVWFKLKKTKRQKIIETWIEQGGDLPNQLDNYSLKTVKNKHEALAVVNALANISFKVKESQTDKASPCSVLLDLMESPGTKRVYGVFRTLGLTELRRLLSEGLIFPQNRKDDLMSIINLLAMISEQEDVSRIATIVKTNFYPDSYYWQLIFENIAEYEDNFTLLISKLKNDLPAGDIGNYFLTVVNDQLLDEKIKEHPYSTEQGFAILKGYLEQPAEKYAFAYNAVVALAFIDTKYSNRLFEIAMRYPDKDVKLEAGWAAAKKGNPAGIELLQQLAADVHSSARACRYMKELELEKEIPEKVKNDPDFSAMSEMSGWLQHPNEYGSSPEKIELFDKRKLYWPPVKKVIPVWLFKYTYPPGKEYRDEYKTEIGMVGSVTFQLYDKNKLDMTPEEIYGLHCTWELDMKKDAKAGWKLVSKYNQDIDNN